MRPFGLRILAFLTVPLILSACGGGGGGSVSSVSGRVVDGYIGGAIVCVDENNNWQCDPEEFPTRTFPDGSYFLPYTGSLDGKQILAEVPEGASDSDFPDEPIRRSFSLVSPAESAERTGGAAEVTLTPFTTMVSKEMMISGASVAQAAEVVREEFGLARSPLNFDFKATRDDKALATAQVLTSAMAVFKETVVDAAAGAGASLSPGEAAMAASRLVRQEVAPVLVKSNGELSIQPCGSGGCTQQALASAVITAAATVVSGVAGRIQTIVAGTKLVKGTPADFRDIFSRGLVILKIDTGDFLHGSGQDLLRINGFDNGFEDQVTIEYMEWGNDRVTTQSTKVLFESAKSFLKSDFSRDLSRIPNPRDVTVESGWYPVWEDVGAVTYWTSSSNTWGTRIQGGGLDTATELEGNCVKLLEDGSGVFKGCVVEKNLAGRPLGEVFPGACQSGGDPLTRGPIPGCDPRSPMPEGSYGYDLGLEADADNYEIKGSSEWSGYNFSGKDHADPAEGAAPTIGRFIEASASDQQYMASCRVAFKIQSKTSSTGTFSWALNRDASCNNPHQQIWNFSETTNYEIKEVAGREVLEVFVPSHYRAAEPGDMIAGCKFAFAVVNRPVLKAGRSPYSSNPSDYEMPTTPLLGIYRGEFCPANQSATYQFTGNLGAANQFMSRAAAEHLARQRGIGLESVIPTR